MKLDRLTTGCAILVLLLTAARPAAARLAPSTFEELASAADLIAVVRVERIDDVGGARVARAVVSEAWRGARTGERIAFLAESTWGCDESQAVVGETALVLLRPRGDGFGEWVRMTYPRWEVEVGAKLRGVRFFEICFAGRGRMALTFVVGDGRDQACLVATRRPRLNRRVGSAFWVSEVCLPPGVDGRPTTVDERFMTPIGTVQHYLVPVSGLKPYVTEESFPRPIALLFGMFGAIGAIIAIWQIRAACLRWYQRG